MDTINFVKVKYHSVSDVYFVSFQNLTTQNSEYLAYPNNNNGIIRVIKNSFTINFTTNFQFNAIGLFNSNKELLAYYFFKQQQNSDHLVNSWKIEYTVAGDLVARAEYFDPREKYQKHADNTDILVGYRKTVDNPGMLNVHKSLQDLGVSSLHDTADNVSVLTQNKNGYLVADSTVQELDETVDSRIRVDQNKFIINKYNTVVKEDKSVPDTALDVVFSTGTGSMSFISADSKINGVSVSLPKTILKPRVEIDKFGGTIVQSFDSTGYPIILRNGKNIGHGLVAPNYCVTGVLGFIYNVPKFIRPLLSYYWAISNKMKQSCKSLGDVIWASPVPLYSAHNDAILYSLLSIYENLGYIKNILISTKGNQEAIQFTVIKQYYGSDYIELPMSKLCELYNFPKIALCNYRERYHDTVQKPIWYPTYSDADSNIMPTPQSDLSALMDIDPYSTTGTDITMDQVRYLPWLAGNIYTEVVLPKLQSGQSIEYNFYNTGAVILEKTSKKITVLLYTPYKNKSNHHTFIVETLPNKMWLDNNILYMIYDSGTKEYNLTADVVTATDTNTKIANNGWKR